MFEKQIRITGKHADYMRLYSKDKQGENTMYFDLDDCEGNQVRCFVFDSLIQCYMCAAMIGIIENRTAEIDNTKTTAANIFAEAVNKNRNNLMRIYYHMVLSLDNDLNVDARIKKAFSVSKENSDAEEQRIESFVRGGLEIINERFENCKTIENFSNEVYNLCEDYNLNNISD